MTASPHTGKSRSWSRRLLKYALLSSAAAALALVGLVCAITWKPAWYRPAAVDFARLDADKAFVTSTTDRISDALVSGSSITVEFDEAQLNRILAARDEWPAAQEYSLGPIADPYVDLRDGDQIRLGARASYGSFRTVVSAVLGFVVADDVLTVRLEGVAAGAAPAPGRASARRAGRAPDSRPGPRRHHAHQRLRLAQRPGPLPHRGDSRRGIEAPPDAQPAVVPRP